MVPSQRIDQSRSTAKTRRCKSIIVDAQQLLLLLATAVLLVQAAAAAFLGQISSFPTPLTGWGHVCGGRMARGGPLWLWQVSI